MSWWRKPSPEEVVRDHAPQVYRQLCRIFGPRSDVDDLFQMVFIEVLR
ncbi:MAG: RNA polymerase sigma factor SigE, partial [Deltaproteobacteria bacterium]|nr:RNA polymerase sigma factor SigE [Deltaproteobacteria bacterium]